MGENSPPDSQARSSKGPKVSAKVIQLVVDNATKRAKERPDG